MKKGIKYWLASKLKIFVNYEFELKYKDRHPFLENEGQCLITKHYKEVFGYRFYPTDMVEESYSLKYLWSINVLGIVWRQVTF